jgi:hypothetical protein
VAVTYLCRRSLGANSPVRAATTLWNIDNSLRCSSSCVPVDLPSGARCPLECLSPDARLLEEEEEPLCGDPCNH